MKTLEQLYETAARAARYSVHEGDDPDQQYAYCIDGEYSEEFPTAAAAWRAACIDNELTLREGEYPGHTHWDWIQVVAQRSTILGYWDWVADCLQYERY